MAGCECGIPDGQKAPRRGTLARAVEHRELKRREQEAARAEVEKYYTQQRALDHAAGNPLKEDISRKEREAKERAREAQLLDSLYQAERTKELALIRAEEEEKLATALVKRQQTKERKDREIQHLKEQSLELRELAEKIRAARVNKERSLQLQEKAQIRAQQAEYDATMNSYVEATDQAALAREQEFQARRREQAIRARQVLEEQMVERQELLREAEQEAARERALVDEVLRRIALEDQATAAAKRQRQDETKAFIAQFLLEQEQNRRRKKEQEAAEDRKIQEYWEAVRQRDAEEAARAAARKEAADHLYEKVKREMEEAMREREREEELINLLRQEEAEEKRRQEDAARKQKAADLRAEIQRANEHQMKLKAEREAVFKAEEEAFRARMMAKFAEDDRLEQLNAQRRRLKQVEHQREVQRLIDERRRMYEEQKARDEAELAAQAAEEQRKLAILEDERKALLREAAELLEFLPRGVLRDQSDLEFVRSHLNTLSVKGQ